MQFLFHDLAGFLLGCLIAVPIMVLPAFAIAHFAGRSGVIPASVWQGWAPLAGVAILPIFDAIIVRYGGIAPMLGVHVLLSAMGLKPLMAAARKISIGYWAMLLLWWLYVAAFYVDFDYAGRLNQSLLVLDLVKHSAIVDAIAHEGLPLTDRFFARPEAAGYYYYFYLFGAAVDVLGRAVVDSRMAFAATAFWIGAGFPVFLWTLVMQSGFVKPGRERHVMNVGIGLSWAMGLDLPAMLLRCLIGAPLEQQLDWWNDEIAFAPVSALWVPHHLSAVIASFAALLLLSDLGSASSRRSIAVRSIVIGICFASAFGMSVWVTVGAAVVMSAWMLSAPRADLPRLIAAALISGAVALCLSLPQILDLLHGRSGDGFPLTLWVRDLGKVGLEPMAARLVMLPIGYVLEFGVFMVGVLWFFRTPGARARWRAPVPRLLVTAFIVGLTLNAFLRSTIINNDFGWRVIWFAQAPAMCWTAAALQLWPDERRISPAVSICFVIGLLGNIWNLNAYRWVRPPTVERTFTVVNPHPYTDHDLRTTYAWAARHLPRSAILQHDPASGRRTFDFGLYGAQRVAVADGESMLFGASKEQVAERIGRIAPLFRDIQPLPSLLSKARLQRIDYLLLTADDPAWRTAGGPPQGARCLFRTRRTCILPVTTR